MQEQFSWGCRHAGCAQCLLICDTRSRKCFVPSSDPPCLPITLLSPTRSSTLLGTSALGYLQAFTWNVSPCGDHRMGYLKDHAESLGRGPSILSWMLPTGTSSRCGRWPTEKTPLTSSPNPPFGAQRFLPTPTSALPRAV